MSKFSSNIDALSAVTVDTTSEVIDLSLRKEVSFQFTCANHTSGNGIFTVLVSNDGVNFVQYNRLVDNLANTNAQNDTRVASVTLNSNTSKIYFLSLGDYFRYAKVAVDVTTDGTYSATVQAID